MKILKSWEDQRAIEEIIDRSLGLLINEEIEERVKEIIARVKYGGDEVLCEYTARFDGVELTPSTLKVTKDEMEEAEVSVDTDFREALDLARANIERFHKEEILRFKSWEMSPEEGILLGQIYRPIEKVGAYIPAGTAPLFSSVLMTCIPAQVAAVKEILITTPPRRDDGKIDPHILVAAKMMGIDQIYKVGGAQAIAAMALGTSTIPKVDKIVGPGNVYVTTAKRSLYGYVDLDTLAGPSEVVILADDKADPRYLAADILAQAEHDPDSGVLLMTTSEQVAKEVRDKISSQIEYLGRKESIYLSLSKGAIILTKDLNEAIAFANRYAPEHLELLVNDPLNILDKIAHSGAIFLGPYSPTSLGDYLAGPSHVLPTMGAARFSSALGVGDFLKSNSLISYDRRNLEKVGPAVIKLAKTEGLEAHAQSVKIRMKGNQPKI